MRYTGLLVAACAALFAQTDSASLRVLVEDSTGAAVAGSKVTLLNSATGVLAEAESSDDGYALFSPIVRGLYEVTVAKSGFKTFKIGEVRINVDERRLLRVRLEVAQIAETVEVTANVTTIQTEQGSLGQVISGKTAVDLPLAGRRYTELALLSPGVAPSTLTP
jgi:hypothetical protein